jgi:hypothetical protein
MRGLSAYFTTSTMWPNNSLFVEAAKVKTECRLNIVRATANENASSTRHKSLGSGNVTGDHDK